MPLKENLTLLNYSSCFTETILFLIRDFDPNKHIYEILKNFLENLVKFKGDNKVINIILFISLIELYKSIGIYSHLGEECRFCKKPILELNEISITNEGALCFACKKSRGFQNIFKISISTYKFLKALESSKYSISTKLNITPDARREIFEYLVIIYKNYTGRNLHSIDVFREITRGIY